MLGIMLVKLLLEMILGMLGLMMMPGLLVLLLVLPLLGILLLLGMPQLIEPASSLFPAFP